MLLKHGCIDFGGGPGLPVVVQATTTTDREFRILDISTHAYASAGPSHGRPLNCEVTKKDEQLVADEIGPFLSRPVLRGGRIVEDADWLRDLMPRFATLSQDVARMSDCTEVYVGQPIDLQLARSAGWEVDESGRTCFGYLNLITDCPQRFWMGFLVRFGADLRVRTVKAVLSEGGRPRSTV